MIRKFFFQFGSEPILIQRKLIGFGAILEKKYLNDACLDEIDGAIISKSSPFWINNYILKSFFTTRFPPKIIIKKLCLKKNNVCISNIAFVI